MKSFMRLVNYLTMIYSRTPVPLRWIFWVGLLFYFIMPMDLFPDVVPGVGRLDDIFMIILGVWVFERSKHFGDFFKQAQREKQGAGRREETKREESTLSAHEVLGVSRNAGAGEIKTAYRKRLSMYHPDKFAHLGPEFEITARKKTEAIIAAYQQLAG